MSGSDDENDEQGAPVPVEGPAGSFFHQVPTPDSSNSSEGDETESDSNSITNETKEEEIEATNDVDEFDDEISKLLRQRRKKPLASRPSTINGVPIEKATGFGKPKAADSKKTGGSKSGSKSGSGAKRTTSKPVSPYVAIGTPDQPINDPTKPERDDQGYTLYTDTQTGEKSRVFEALVDYPSIFTMKIVGANEGTFVSDIVALVSEACETEVTNVKHSTKVMGKWVSVTVKAPVQSAEMLYSLYEKVDLDPRVKFKF
jgi:putative lipoic acid-binding regulatory protein